MNQEPTPADHLSLDNRDKITRLDEFRKYADRDIKQIKVDLENIKKMISEIVGVKKFTVPVWVMAFSVCVAVLYMVGNNILGN